MILSQRFKIWNTLYKVFWYKCIY